MLVASLSVGEDWTAWGRLTPPMWLAFAAFAGLVMRRSSGIGYNVLLLLDHGPATPNACFACPKFGLCFNAKLNCSRAALSSPRF